MSLFGDELDVGYQAYSVLKTGKDYYGNSWPMHFHSLAEWRTPLYLYSCVPTVALFGISAWGVRLPAAVFGILGVWLMYLLVKELFDDEKLGVVAALVTAISPWHIQYSRAAFEVTELLFLLLLGLVLFIKALKQRKRLWLAMACFGLMPWVYSTAKMFTPMLIGFLVILWWRELIRFSRKELAWAAITLAVVAGPIAYSTVFGGGAERFGYISVFTNPVMETEVGVARLNDARMRGEMGEGISPKLTDRMFHNKFTYWSENILDNYFKAFSTDFLFVQGDPNLRHSVHGMGQFYKVEAVMMIAGLVIFITGGLDRRKKWLLGLWLIAGILPAAITRDGGNHATRLILILPPLIILVSLGMARLSKRLFIVYSVLLLINFVFYMHGYWMHNPWYAERWWHSGFEEAIQKVKEIDGRYERIVITTASEPPWVFFAAWYQYPPDEWQREFPIGNNVDLDGFGRVSHIGKFYFGSPEVEGFYAWNQVIDKRTLYLASEKEVKVNLISEPKRTPPGLHLIKAISYPSGEPAFYLFDGEESDSE